MDVSKLTPKDILEMSEDKFAIIIFATGPIEPPERESIFVSTDTWNRLCDFFGIDCISKAHAAAVRINRQYFKRKDGFIPKEWSKYDSLSRPED